MIQILKVTWQHLVLNMVFLLVLLLTVALQRLLHKVYQVLMQVGDWRNHFTAEQNARFKAVWEQKMGGTALSQSFAM